MRYIILCASVFLLAACASQGTKSTTVSGEMVRSLISTQEYNIALQKEIPSPTYGSGPRNITIYADYQCPACMNFSLGVGKILDSYAEKGKVTITHKQFPLTTIHRNAYRDAIAALCATEQGKFLPAKDALYALESKKAGAAVSDAERVKALVDVGLDEAPLAQCLAESRYARQVDNEVIAGDKLGVSGTPTVYLDGTRLDIGRIFSDMEKGIAFLDRLFAE